MGCIFADAHYTFTAPRQGPSMLDPQARALIDLMAERQIPPTHTLPHADARRFYRERRSHHPARPARRGRRARPARRRPARRWSRCGCTNRCRAPGRTRCWCTSTAAAGSSATSTRTTWCAASCARQRLRGAVGGLPAGPRAPLPGRARRRLAAVRWVREQAPRTGWTPRASRWAATAPVATWRPSPPSPCATRARRRPCCSC
jgi:hypothetical protein